MPAPRDEANAEQRRAADPAVSAFVAASAGSGKTKLLTDRLLRLLLGGAEPGRIQCLTFTKAAAAEMALRLQHVLGRWVTLDDAALTAELAALDVAPSARVGASMPAAARERARALFARVLDLPGGMRISTIHAFCQSLLRRFPLEARISPHFRVIEDADAAIALQRAREAMLEGAHDPARQADLAALAGQVDLARFGELVEQLRQRPAAFAAAAGDPALERRLRAALGAADPAALPEAVATGADRRALRRAMAALLADAPPSGRALAERLGEWLALDPAARAEAHAEWQALFLLADGSARKPGGLVRGTYLDGAPEIAAILLAEQARLLALADAARAWGVAALSAALVRLAAPVAGAYAAGKRAAGRLDHDDLIARAAALLVDPGAAWVLFKLDGGLDHLLLDEVQDTAPAQWEIAGALAREFFVGEGARPGSRSVFAVGDRKQSIYGFQGADPDGFETWRARLAAMVRDGGQGWVDGALRVSFRSTAPVLELVDRVFAQPAAAAGVVAAGEALTHLSDRAGAAGRVELWPLAPLPQAEAAEPWAVAAANRASLSAPQALADALAGWIAGQLGGGVMLESRGRALGPGDVLVLVRRRNAFASALVRALKRHGVPVAGLDRLVLTAQPAVADLLALCDALLLPEDDLALAGVLTSPLGGLSDDSLMALALGRGGTLWQALRARRGERAEWAAACALLETLLARVDFVTPHALLVEALGVLGGRARLLARLGPEAAEPVDELLAAALRHAATHPPGLQGFVQWLRQSGAEVKREAGGPAGLVRVMTVHGAKGLQAPLVILPDTTSLPPAETGVAWTGEGLPVWAPHASLRSASAEAPRRAAALRQAEEHNRLLYVALTRAEDRLLVCGWQRARGPAAGCWYELVRAAVEGLAAEGRAQPAAAPFAGAAWALASPQTAPPRPEPAAARGAAAALPGWVAAPPAPEPARPAHLAPSRPEGAELGPVPQAASPLAGGAARFRRGSAVHALLQHLPALPAAARPAAALRFLRGVEGVGAEDAETVAAEVLAVLAHPALAPLFGPDGRAEVPLAGVVAGRVIGGLVDRLAVGPERVLVCDYKTNRAPPASAAAVPVLYLRQMAAYRAVLRQVFPGRAVECALVWTVGATVMPLPDALLDSHAPGEGEARQG
jgi:ATP-dependent helicase/nuclease subunit A